MRIQCDVCEQKAAAVICCADEAALCAECDVKVHHANKLASKHKRLPLLASNSNPSRCDVCQDKAAFVFCLEDRALLCRDCDESVHSRETLAAKHQRFLATGIRVALSGGDECPEKEPAEAKPPYVDSCWNVDELLPLSDFDSKGDQGNLGEIDWNIEDIGLFVEENEECPVEVPQLSTSPQTIAMNGMNGRAGGGKPNLSSTKVKSKNVAIPLVPDFDEASFIVPDIGILDTGSFQTLPAKRMRVSSFYML